MEGSTLKNDALVEICNFTSRLGGFCYTLTSVQLYLSHFIADTLELRFINDFIIVLETPEPR